ncbi:ligand-effect modulator 3 family [Hyaloraphidium curvatum]|nr:ligand-effect modulator 3 family [Hyaloraphidium curvatum]
MSSSLVDTKQSRKPANTAFKQQRLKAWQPILTPKTVIPTFFIIGTIFVPIGIGLYIASDRVQQVVFDYTYCNSSSPTFSSPVTQMLYFPDTQICRIQWRQDQTIPSSVLLYYRLTNFYQNHRRYVKSYDPNQLQGAKIESASGTNVNCAPLQGPGGNPQYYPCGLIANSMFSDSIGSPRLVSTTDANYQAFVGQQFTFSQNGIAWPSDASKYQTSQWFTDWSPSIPATSVGGATWIQQNLLPPPAWITGFAWAGWANGYDVTRGPVQFGSSVDNVTNSGGYPDLDTWERLQVWMRVAGLPTFRKLWGRNDAQTMPSGTWEIDIGFHFNVAQFGGTKAIVISNVSVIGGKNPFLGIAYMVVGALCWVLGISFLIRHMVKPRKLGDHSYLSWNQTQAPGAPGTAQLQAPPRQKPAEPIPMQPLNG